MTGRDRTLLLGLAALTTAFAALTLIGVHEDVLLAAPALVLALLLLAGRHVGEDAIARLAAAYDPSGRPRRRRAVASLTRRCSARRGFSPAVAA